MLKLEVCFVNVQMMKNNLYNKDLEFIKAFSKIKISSICKELCIDRSNLLNGKSSNENIKKVKDKIIEKYNEILGGKNYE